jgi:hypothetical protein
LIRYEYCRLSVVTPPRPEAVRSDLPGVAIFQSTTVAAAEQFLWESQRTSASLMMSAHCADAHTRCVRSVTDRGVAYEMLPCGRSGPAEIRQVRRHMSDMERSELDDTEGHG